MKAQDERVPVTFGGILIMTVFLAVFAYSRLSTNPWIPPVVVAVLAVGQICKFVLSWKTLTVFDIGFDLSALAVLLSFAFGPFRREIAAHPTILFVTVLYRPEYLKHGNRAVAFLLGLVALGTTLPVALGKVRESDVLDFLCVLYALVVFCMWLLCSKIGSSVIESLKARKV